MKRIAEASCCIFTTEKGMTCPLCSAAVTPNVEHRCATVGVREAEPVKRKKRSAGK